ncbi:Uncharacterized protein DBV15_07398 [Temnothorax longispinosus]|uniref:Uncharacterized protein n=1 Tax=Temnothorax longispinosus TaxID=300112 RepID=A0A4S2KYW9_9HYME|nr:Uncharacterized protein DBV15_07398 [Temnothorax longispinosus]
MTQDTPASSDLSYSHGSNSSPTLTGMYMAAGISFELIISYTFTPDTLSAEIRVPVPSYSENVLYTSPVGMVRWRTSELAPSGCHHHNGMPGPAHRNRYEHYDYTEPRLSPVSKDSRIATDDYREMRESPPRTQNR